MSHNLRSQNLKEINLTKQINGLDKTIQFDKTTKV